ncbi:hypothetical protein DL95DRAFT_409010 [Leptodontidium sp. 2 PMI_412]|nr:hypothetical protein DL95DRAFT_409010 [Leptodontidium sp. 2 PMI_412]
MICGLLRIMRKGSSESHSSSAAPSSQKSEGSPSYCKAASSKQNSESREDDNENHLTPQVTFAHIMESLRSKREELLDSIEDEPYTVHQAKLRFQEAVSNYGKAGWGDEGRQEYNRAERQYQLIQEKHRQNQRKLRAIERDIQEWKASHP